MKDKSQEFADRMVKTLKDVDRHPEKYSSMEFDKDFAYGLDNEIEHLTTKEMKTKTVQKMEECSKEFIDMIIIEVTKSPDSQIDNCVRAKLKDCKGGTYADKYDVIVEISKMDLTKISSFVRELCALDKHYLKPNK